MNARRVFESSEMATCRLPKSSAEIIASAKKAYAKNIRPRKPKIPFGLEDHLSIFTAVPSGSTSHEGPTTSVFCRTAPANAQVSFKDPITPQTFEVAPEIKSKEDIEMGRCEEFKSDDEGDLDTLVPMSELNSSPVDSNSSMQTHTYPSERIQEVLSVLQHHRLSPFDLVLEILNEKNPEYSSYRTEFYEEGNERLSKLLDAISSNVSGKKKVEMWMRQSNTLDLLGDLVTDERNAVQKAELLPGIAAVTPE